MKIVLASNNPGKIREFAHLFADLPIELIPQADLGVEEVHESGLSFIENALIKARHAAKVTGLAALADDSGLAVAALEGRPGIYSARYAGDNATSADNIKKLLAEMKDIAPEKRKACFHCVLAFMSHALDPTPLICSGRWPGMIAFSPKGTHGFGYDPVFYIPKEQKTAAEISGELKNKLSHRTIALQLLLKELPEKLCQLSPLKN